MRQPLGRSRSSRTHSGSGGKVVRPRGTVSREFFEPDSVKVTPNLRDLLPRVKFSNVTQVIGAGRTARTAPRCGSETAESPQIAFPETLAGQPFRNERERRAKRKARTARRTRSFFLAASARKREPRKRFET